MTDYRFLKQVTHSSGVCVLTISRPDALNALNAEVLQELKCALTKISQDPKIRVLVFTGEGKSFIAGADIKEMAEKSIDAAIAFAKLGHEVTKLFELMLKPTVAAVNGFALGGGTEMAISCDFIYASEKALFGQPEVGLGIIPGFGGTVRLSRFVGLPRAKELIFSGKKIKADEACRIGLVNEVFSSENFLETVIKRAEEIATNSAAAVSSAKKLLNDFSESIGLNYKLDSEAHEFGILFKHPDQKEGMSAFTEKRKPRFEGLELS